MQLPAVLTPATCALLARHQLLKPLVRSLMLEQLTAEVELTSEQRLEAQQAFRAENNLTSDAEFSRWLEQQGLDQRSFAAMVTTREQRRQLVERRFAAKAEARFLDRKNQLDRVVYSLLRVDDRDLANELFYRLQAGEADFAQLAADYAQGPERQTRGIVGPVPLTQAHPILAERLRTSQAGQLLQPFPIEQWWLVVRLESYSPASLDAAVRQQMTMELFEEWLDQQVHDTVTQLQSQIAAVLDPTP